MFEEFLSQVDAAFATIGENKKRLNEHQNDMEEIHAMVAKIQNEVNTANTIVESTNHKVETLATEINTLLADIQTKLQKITDKNYLELQR